MRRIVLLLALAAITAAVMVSSSALPAMAQDTGMNCGWWWGLVVRMVLGLLLAFLGA